MIFKLCMTLDLIILNIFLNWLYFNYQQNSWYKFWNRFKFESPLNFKGDQILWKKSGKFAKNLSWLDLHKCKFSWAHLYAIIWSSKTSVHRTRFELREMSLYSKFKPKHARISFKLPNYILKYCWSIAAATMTLGVLHGLICNFSIKIIKYLHSLEFFLK
jgi:hypothetical protein